MPEARRDSQSEAAVVLDSYGFRVPCRSFYVKANVTRDRRLPVVDEHVLRLVRTCGRIPVGRLRAFFGMSRSESERVVEDLATSGLLIVEGEDVSLSATAVAMFKSHPDEEARLMTVEPWIENVWVELVSRAFVSMPRARPSRNLVEIAPPASSLDLPESFARSAFEDNFHDYVRRVKRMRDPDRISIHSIAEVEADRYGSVAFVGRKVLDPDASLPRFEVAATESDLQAPAGAGPSITRLVQTLADHYGRLDRPRASSASLDAFDRLTGRTLRRVVDPETGRVRIDELRRDVASGLLLWGASYLARNVELLVASVGVSEIAPDASLSWMRPGGSSWGVTSDLVEALSALKSTVAGRCLTELLVPRSARHDAKRRFATLFETGLEAPARFGNSLEIVVVGKAAAMVLAHLPVDARETVAIGVLVKDRTAVRRIAKAIASDTFLWAPSASVVAETGES